VPRFSLKSLLACVTFIAISIGSLMVMLRAGNAPSWTWSVKQVLLIFVSWLAAGPLFGAGIGVLYGRAQKGAFWGLVVQGGLTTFVLLKIHTRF
jgi:hypothetical protein